MVEEEVKTYLGKNVQKKSKAVLNLESHLKIVRMQGLLEFIWTGGRVLMPNIKPRPSFGYLTIVLLVNFSFANSTTGANFRGFFVHGISYRPTE
jgi:hypothetical protein